MTVVDSGMQDLDSIEDEDILRRMLLQTDDFAEKKRIRTRISKLKEKRLKEFYASDDVTGSHTENTMFSGSQTTFSASRHEVETTTCADTGFRFADSRKRSSQEHLEEIQVDEKMRKCEEIIDARIRKKSQERGKRLQQIKSEMEKSENISISQASHATQLAVTTDRRGKNVTEPVVNGTARNSSTRDRSSDRIEVLTKPTTNIIQDTKSFGITGEKEFEATERTVESRKVFKCSPDSSLDRDSIEPPIRATKFSPFDAANVRKVSMEAVEKSILDSMEVIENIPEPVKVQPLMPNDALSSREKSKSERKVSSPKKEEPELKSSRSESRKTSTEVAEKKIRSRQESLKLDLDIEPVIEDVSDATTPYLLARKQSSDYSVMSPEPLPLESRRLSEVEIEDVTDSTVGEDELDDADEVVVQPGNKKLSTIEETPRKSSLKKTTTSSDSPRKVSVPSASSERAGSPSRRCCRRGTTPEATPLTPAEKREQLIARKISVTDEEFERMEKEILEEEIQETSNSPRKTKSPEKSDVEPKRVRKISPTENKARSSLPSVTGSLKPARRVDSKENALKSVQKPAEKLRTPAKQPESISYTKKPSDERPKVSPVKSPTKSKLPAAQTKSPARSARGQYSPKSSKELTLTAKREPVEEESASNDPVAKNNPDLNDAKKKVQAAPEISMPSLVKSTPADMPRSALSSRESTPKADDSSRKTKPERRNSKDEKNKKEYKRQDSGKVNGERRNFEVIEDVELLERLLESAKEYDERSRIRARLRILKKPLSGIPTRNTSSPRASPLLGRRAMPTVEKKTATPSPMRKIETPKRTEPSRPKKEDKPLPDEVAFEFKLAGNAPVSEPRPVMDHPYENIPEQPVEDSVMRRSPSPVVQSVRRISEIRRSVSPAPLERGPSFRRSPSPVITSGSVIYRPQKPVDPAVPEPEIRSSPPAERRKSAIKLALNAESTTIINDPVTNITTVLNATVSEAPQPKLEAAVAVPEPAQTPSEKPNKFGRSLTSQLSFPNLRLSEDDPSLPQGPDETRVITSSYGVGPTDDAGKPLFGLGALRKARNKTPESDTAPDTLDAAEKAKRDQGPVDSAGRPLFGLGALRAPRTPDEPSYNQTSKSVLDIIKSHEREGPIADRPDVIPERPRARKRDSFILEDEQATEVKEPIMERSPNLKGIIQQHEDVSMRPIEFKVDLNRAGGPAILIGRSQPLQEVISRHEQAIIEDAKIAAVTTSKIELDKSLPISEAIRKHEQAIVEDKVISTSKISVEVEKSLPVKEALNLHKSAIEMDGKTVIPKRTVEVEKTQSIRDIIDIHKQKQEDETVIDVKDVVSSPRPRRKLRDTFLDATPANPAAATTPVKRPGILKKPKESHTPLPEPVVEPSSQPDPYANLERVEICNRNSPAEKRVSIDNTVLVNGQSNSSIPEDAAPWRRRSANSSPSRADQVEPTNVVTSRFEITSEESQTFELPSWRNRREPECDRKAEPERKPSRDRREQIEPVSVPDWRRRTVPEEPVSQAGEPSWRNVPEPVVKASEPAWRKSVRPEEPVKTRLSRVEAAPESAPSWRSRAASRTEVEKPVFEAKLPEQPVSENEPAWRKQSAERQPVYEELKRATVEPTVTVRTAYAPPSTVESKVTSSSRYSREETRKYSTGLEQRPEQLRNLAASPELRSVTIEPAVTLRTAVTPSPNVESTVTSSSRYSRDETRKYSTGLEQRPEDLRNVVPSSQEFSRDSSPTSNPLTPAELRQASVAKTEHRNSVTERWQPKTQPITNAYAVSLERTSRQNTPSRQTTPERTTDNTFASKYTAPRMAVSSVKGLAQKFMQTVEDTGSPPKVNKSYPKAGLIFRSSSFKNSQGLTPPEQEGSSLRRTGSLRTEGSPSWRRASKENADPNYDASPPWRRKSINHPDEDAPITRDFSSPTPKSFLDDHSKVTGVSDILDRMRAGNTVVGEDGPKTDEEAKSLLNKFLGAQIIMQGIEPMLQPSNGLSQVRGHLQDSLSSSQIVREQQRQQQQWNSLDTKPTRMGESVVISGIDILTCDDDFKLNELLDTCNDYDTRQKIKARIRDLLAAQRQGSVTGLQKSVSASQSTNATVVQQQNQGFVRSSVTSSSFRTQSNSSTVTVNPGGSAFSKFQQLDRANSSSSPRTPLSATAGTAFSFSAPSTKSGVFTVKDAILQWCQGRTRGYKNVQVTDFSTSWTDGLAFCALIHHFYPDAFDFDSLDPKNRRYNLDLAFRTADEKAGIAPLLDVEDMISMRKPDWKCVFTYIQTFYRRLKDQ